MTLSAYKEGCQIIRENLEIARFSGPHPSDLVKQVEVKLGLSLSVTYATFLKDFGYLQFGGIEIYGIVDESLGEMSVPNGIWVTLNERKKYNLPHGLVVIAAADDGGHYVIDHSKFCETGQAPVVEYEVALPSDQAIIREVANDFGEFLLESIRTALEWRDMDIGMKK